MTDPSKPPRSSSASAQSSAHSSATVVAEADQTASSRVDFLTEELIQVRTELELTRREVKRQLNNLPHGYLTLNAQGVILTANLRAEELLTSGHAELSGTSLTRSVARAYQLLFSEARRLLFEQRDTRELEVRMSRADGSTFWAQISMAWDTDSVTGAPIARVLLKDVTERKAASEEMLAHSDDVLAVFDSTPAMLCVLDEEQRILFANRALQDYLGTSIKDLHFGRACGAFGCIKSRDHPRGCGHGPDCAVCELNNAIQSTLQTGIPFQDVEFRTTLVNEAGSRDVILLAATARVVAENQNRVLLTLADITDRHRMERNLREAQERFQTLFQTIPDAIMLTRLADGVIVEVNEAFATLSGYSRFETIGRGILDIQIWENPADRDALLAKLRETGTCSNVEAAFRLKGGRKGTGLVSARIIQLQNVAHIISVTRDITEQKEIERALATSELQFRLLFEHHNDAILWADVDGYLVRCNQAAEKLFERSRDELIGMHQTALHPPQRLDFYQELFKDNSKNRNNVTTDLEIISKSGTTKLVEIFSTIIEVDGRTITQGIFVDISERVAAQEQIQYQLSLQALLMDLSLLFLNVSTDFLDHALHEALARVGAFSETDRVYIFSYDFEHRTMRNTHEWCAPGIKPEIQALQHVSFEEAPSQISSHQAGEPFYIPDVQTLPLTDPLRRHLSSQNILSVLSLPLLDGQECIGFVGFDSVRHPREWSTTEIKLFMVLGELLVNVFRRKRREEELRAARTEAERANVAKSRFLATMSHEIRTPMNGVVGMTELLLDTELNEEQARYAQVIHSSGEALLGLINDILDFSKIEADKLELEILPFSLPEVLDGTVNMLTVTAQAKGLNLGWQIHPDVPTALMGDPLRLRQILLNLCGNAVKFTQKGEVLIEVHGSRFTGSAVGGGEVHGSRFTGSAVGETANGDVAAGAKILTSGSVAPNAPHCATTPAPTLNREPLNRESLNREPPNPDPCFVQLRFTVRDTGPGIPPDKLQLLFQRFQQVDASTTRQFGGTGLGLAISKRLVKMMGGGIGVESTEGQGSTFWFTARFVEQSCICATPTATRRTMTRETPQTERPIQLSLVQPGTRVLLVEDNPVNQLVAGRMLNKLGMIADTANNGQEAVAAVEKQAYDLVFMDIEMPVMDGVEATKQIRKAEEERRKAEGGGRKAEGSTAASSDLHPSASILHPLHRRQPVIALTAHAVQGDRERFLVEGFDDYLTKPLRFEALRETVLRWTQPAHSPGESISDTAPCPVSGLESDTEIVDVCNKPDLLDRVMGDHELAGDVLRSLVDNGAQRIAAIKTCLTSGDARAAGREAHGLKGAALNCSCPHLAEVARKMEDAGQNNDLDALRGLLPRLERDFAAVCDLVARFAF